MKDLSHAQWVFTGASVDSGYAKLMFAQHGMPAPPAGAIVNSTLGLLSIITSGDFVGLMPYQIATHPLAAEYLSVVPTREGPLQLTIGAMVKSDAVVFPAIRHFIAHLHRAAHQAGRSNGSIR